MPWAKSNPPSPYYMQVLSQPRPRLRLRPRTSRGRTCPRRRATSILHGTRGRPVTLRFIDGKRSYEVKKPFEGVIGNLNRRMLADRIRLDARGAQPLPGVAARAKSATAPASSPRRSAVKIAGEDISHVDPPQRRRRARLVRDAPREAHPHPERDRQGDPQGDQRAPRLPPQCRARLSPPRPHQRHPLGRREPAHPPRQPDRQRPLGRALRPRRALDRPPPEGQRPPPRDAQAPARPRQHRARRRA